MKQKIYLFIVFAVFALGIMTLAGCHHKQKQEEQQAIESRKKAKDRFKNKFKNRSKNKNGKRNSGKPKRKRPDLNKNQPQEITAGDSSETSTQVSETGTDDLNPVETQAIKDPETIFYDGTWEYASFSKINTGTATLYHSQDSIPKGITVCVNAGHGTSGGSSKETQCHPDGSPKLYPGPPVRETQHHLPYQRVPASRMEARRQKLHYLWLLS